MSTKPKAPKGHKRAAISYGVSVRCECGWSSPTCYGPGARSEAHRLLKYHQQGVAAETENASKHETQL